MTSLSVIMDLTTFTDLVAHTQRQQSSYALVNELTGQQVSLEVDTPAVGAVTITLFDSDWGERYA